MACAALGCEPDGVCVISTNGVRSCKWNSPCGTCPTGATCKTVHTSFIEEADVPYCECPKGFGMTATECKEGAPDQVVASSITLIQDRSASGTASKPYTFRLKSGCNQYPKEVAGNYKTLYALENIGGTKGCASVELYTDDYCIWGIRTCRATTGDSMAARANT
ncbi:unnamed protein product, partial [Closterium sp. Naga37s-1]